MTGLEIVAALRSAGCVFAEEEATVILSSATDSGDIARMVGQRCEGRPLEHVVGWAEVAGVRVHVDPGVFVPRRRSELLIREATRLARPAAVVVDLCCGSGALGAAVAATVPVELFAADIDPGAVRCARRNVPTVYEGDLFDAFPDSLRGRIDVLLCNTPYVPTDEIALLPAEARDHEPRGTLDGGGDGLDVQRRVAAEASPWLAAGGSVLCEVSDRQEAAAECVFAAYETRLVRDVDLGATVVVATTGA